MRVVDSTPNETLTVPLPGLITTYMDCPAYGTDRRGDHIATKRKSERRERRLTVISTRRPWDSEAMAQAVALFVLQRVQDRPAVDTTESDADMNAS